MRYFAVGLLLLLPLGAATAQTMPVSTFLVKAEALRKKGPFALMSSDYKLLKGEVNNAAKALGREQRAARQAGRKPATCMPGQVSIGTDELLGHLRSIPAGQRNISIQAALASFMNRKYPCPS